jgi:hypothetical protein
MGSNFHTPYDESSVYFKAVYMNPPLASLDQAVTYPKNAMVHCDGRIHYNAVTGVLTWTDTLRIIFNRSDGKATTNKVTAGTITLADNEFAYVVLNETNDTTIAMAKAAVSPGSASNFMALALIVMGYRNTAGDRFYPVHMKSVEESVIVLASSANVTIDWSKGRRQSIVLGHDAAFTHSGGVDGETYLLYIRQDPASARTPTWVNNRYGTEIASIAISATLSSENIAEFVYRAGIGYCAIRSVSAYVAP